MSEINNYLSQITRCKYCGSVNLKFTRTPTTIHYGRLDCAHCGTFCAWAKNPDSPRGDSKRINKKTVKEVSNFHNFDEEFCFMCLRKRDQLGVNETLTIDHIKELDKGGYDTITNMQVLCSACHKLKNWSRLYMNWHLKEGVKEDDSEEITT